MADVFISYAGSDRQIAEAISERLGALGISTFFDSDILPGDSFREWIAQQLETSKVIVVIWSTQSGNSLFTREEMRVALEAWEDERLFLVRLDNAELPVGLRDIYYHDYSGVCADKIAASVASAVLKILQPHVESDYCFADVATRRILPTWITILLLLGSGIFLYLSLSQSTRHYEQGDAISSTGTITVVSIIVIAFSSVVVGLVLFLRRRRGLLTPAGPRARNRYEHYEIGPSDEWGPPLEGILFVSYSRDDRRKVSFLVRQLERAGLKTWVDTRRESDAQRFARSIVEAIRSSKACAFMCSSTAQIRIMLSASSI